VSHSNGGSGSGLLRDSLRGNISFVLSLVWEWVLLVFGRPGLVAGGESLSSAAVGLSQRPDARRQSPGEDGVC